MSENAVSRLEQLLDFHKYLHEDPFDGQTRQRLHAVLAAEFPTVIEDFYAELQRHAGSSRVLTGGERQVARLKASLLHWLESLFLAPRDETYIRSRLQVGERHVAIGLDPFHVSEAFARLRQQLQLRLLRLQVGNDPSESQRLVMALNGLLDIDQMLVAEAYYAAARRLERPLDEARIRQQSWLARVSQLALAGESLSALMDHVAAALLAGLQPDRCGVLQAESAEPMFRLLAGAGWDSCELGQRTWAGESAQWWRFVVQQVVPVASLDLRNDARGCCPEDFRLAGVVSVAYAAVGDAAGPFGVIGVDFFRRVEVSESDLDFLQSLANLLTTAIRREAQEQTLRDNEQRLRRLIERLPAGAVYLGEDRLAMNAAMEELTGYRREQLTTRADWRQLVVAETTPAELANEVATAPGVAVEPIVRRLETWRRADGQLRRIEITALRAAVDEVWLVRDITLAEEQHERALQAERLATIGQMIAGLAHESRNSLQRIRANAEMLELELPADSHAVPFLQRIGLAVDDLRRLFDEVRGYAAPLALEIRDVPLSSLIAEAWEAVARQRQDRVVRLCSEIPEPALWVRVDGFRVSQVFRNLFENSLAACVDPVEIVVRATPAAELEGAAVEVAVRDNGPGLTDEAYRRVFDPFFTTKTKGTGLGMAIAARVISAHGGKIWACPPVQTGERDGGDAIRMGGAEFRFQLPTGWAGRTAAAGSAQ